MESDKLKEAKQLFDRRDFMGLAAAVAAIGVGTAMPVATASAAASTDFTRWLNGISGKHKVVLDVREPGDGMGVVWTWVYLFTAPQAYGVKESALGTVVVFRHNAIPFVLEDSMWNKYGLGAYFKINDPATSAPALRNPYYATPVDPSVPDMTLKNHIERGVKVVACDMAIHYFSGQIAKEQGLVHDEVKADWNKALLPGIAHAPSGVVACQGAVAKGCSYVFAG